MKKLENKPGLKITNKFYSSFSGSNNYYKGTLDCLEVWNNGKKELSTYYEIPLYDSEGNFFMTYRDRVIEEEINDTKVYPSEDYEGFGWYKYMFQYNYNFYIIPTIRRLTIRDNREWFRDAISEFGLEGFFEKEQDTYLENRYIKSIHGNTVEIPLEYCGYIYRSSPEDFMNFNYANYIKNYEKALIKYPKYKEKLERLKNYNIKIICDFYGVTEKELSSKNFNQIKHTIRAFNKKIKNKRKYETS